MTEQPGDRPAQMQEQYEFIIELARKANIRLTRELTNACAARDALARECNQLKGERAFNAQTTRESIALRTTLMKARVVFNSMRVEKQEYKHELTQARKELKDLQGANQAFVSQLADVTANREFWYKEAQDAEAERDEWHKDWESATAEALNALQHALQRTKRAEALAQLVNEETAALLERLGRPWYEVPMTRVKDDFTIARALAAQIREALDDSQA